MASTPVNIRSTPGIKRDGTSFEGDQYIDGQWCRFQRGLPRKMGGYRGLTSLLPEVSRGLSAYANNAIQYMHSGGQDKLVQVRSDAQGLFTGFSDRTPAAYSPNANALWQYALVPSTITNILAHPGSNLSDISSDVVKPFYYGRADLAAPLVDTGITPDSGGIVGLGPYIFTFGSSGHIAWTNPNLFTPQAEAWVTGQKIVKGFPLRGGQVGPAGIFWSLDSVIVANFIGGVPASGPTWSFNEVTTETSILSSQGVIEYDGIYYWAGMDRFLMFNGVVREVPNETNLNWFFDNLNYAQRQKVFAYKVPKYGEIWWCYPRGTATECTHAVIFNVRYNIWYDTQLPTTGRSAGIYAKVYNKPFMADLVQTVDGYTLWQHETGTDSINGSTILAIRSYFQTSDITLLIGDKPQDKALRVSRVEPDFVQIGDLTVTSTGRSNARSADQTTEQKVFPAVATTPEEQTVTFKNTRRIMNFKFESNQAGGDYQMGQCIGHLDPADGRITQ